MNIHNHLTTHQRLLAFALCHLHALNRGANAEAVRDAFAPLARRKVLFRYLCHQIEAVWAHRTPRDYPEFLQREDLTRHAHSRRYLASCGAGAPRPPLDYFSALPLADLDADERRLVKRLVAAPEEAAPRPGA